jgi:hypothetical protein
MTTLRHLTWYRVRRLAVALGGLGAAATLAACSSGTAPVPGHPMIVFALDSTAVQGDSIHGNVVATGDKDLVSLFVTVFDTAGADSTGTLVGGGQSVPAGRLSEKFAYVVVNTVAGRYLRFSAIAFDEFGDSTIARDSARVVP